LKLQDTNKFDFANEYALLKEASVANIKIDITHLRSKIWHSPRMKTRKDIKPIPSAKENTIVSILLRPFGKLKTLSNL
jgi:hypothetical protein